MQDYNFQQRGRKKGQKETERKENTSKNGEKQARKKNSACLSVSFSHWRTGGGGGGGAWGRLPPPPPPNKNNPCLVLNSIQAYPYSTCRQVEFSFLGLPQIAHSQVEMKKLPAVGGGTPPSDTLAPLGRYAPSGLVASLPRKDSAPPPQMFWLITPLPSLIIPLMKMS